jgi:hypothetical protein
MRRLIRTKLPQALAYAKIADIPVEIGLMSSWLPGLIYTLMGTSKGRIKTAYDATDISNVSFQIFPPVQHRFSACSRQRLSKTWLPRASKQNVLHRP